MSVINKMLNDLDKRKQTEQSGVYVAPETKTGRVPLVAACVVSAVLTAAVGVGTWYFAKNSDANVADSQPAKKAEVALREDEVKKEQPVASEKTIGTPADDPAQSQSKPAPIMKKATAIEAQEQDVKEPSAVAKTPEELKELEDYVYGPDEPKSVQDTRGYEKSEPRKESVIRVTEARLSKAEESALDMKDAETAIARGDMKSAKKSLESVLAREPKNTEARKRLASLHFGTGDIARAKEVLLQGIKLDPTYSDYRLLLARILADQGKHKEALAALAAYSPKAEEGNIDYYASEAALAMDLKDTGLAVASYGKLTKIAPSEGRWWMGLAIAFERQGALSAAKSNYKKALAVGLPDASRAFAQKRLAELGE